ncbi:hypothetical protein [Curtobacterium flaccumfaciens]|uniref:hypothetical protein n=1 Tax=Curtobacterium flaccumfaciens TaxID=2035 RepID=UPI0034300005
MNNRQAAVIAAASRGTDNRNLEREARVLEFWLDELDRAEAANELPRTLEWITIAVEAIADLELAQGEPVHSLQINGESPVATLASGRTYQFEKDRWMSRGAF